MSLSYTTTQSNTFTVTHARYIASKVAADLKRMQRFYNDPSDSRIESFEAEIIELLKAGYLKTVIYGYQRNGQWIVPTLRYTAHDLLNGIGSDDDPGKIRPGANVEGASFYSYLIYSSAWHSLSDVQRENFGKRLPFLRSGVPEPAVDGYFTDDRTYSSGGRALNRASVRSFG